MFDRKEWMKQWRKDNSEHIKEYRRKYCRTNSEHIKEYKRKWNKDNSEHINKLRRQRYLRDPEKRIKQAKLWRRNNLEKVKKNVKRYYENHYEEIKKYKKNYLEERRQNHKSKVKYVQDYKLSKGCQFCGYNKNPRLLGFHHPNDDKEFNVSHAVTQEMSLKRIKEEMRKCIVLCNSCHSKLSRRLKREGKKKLLTKK